MNKYIKQAHKLTKEHDLCRATKSYSIDTNKNMVQIMERVWCDMMIEETKFLFGPIIEDNIELSIEMLKARATYEFLGVDYVEETEEPAKKTKKTRKKQTKKEPVVVDGPKSEVGNDEDTEGSGEGETADSGDDQVEMDLTIPNNTDGKVIMGTGMPEKEEVKKEKKVVIKVVNYDRNEQDHRAELATILGEVSPDWRKTEDLKKKAKDLSHNLIGKPFMSDKGEILDEFYTAVKEGMA